jgi:hypothetical protein
MDVDSGTTNSQFKLGATLANATPLLTGDLANNYLYLKSDSHRLYFGAGDDAYLNYDGTDLQVSPKVVGSGYLNVNGTIQQDGRFAEIYVDDGSTAQSIPTGATATKATGFTTNGPSSDCTADVANDKITITKTGIYQVSQDASFASGTANVVWQGHIYVGGVKTHVGWERKTGTANDVGDAGHAGLIDITSVPVDIDLRIVHDNGGSVNFVPSHMAIVVNYIGAT